MGTVRSVDSDRIAAMIDKLSRIFEASGIRTGVTEGSIRAAIVSRYGIPADSVYLQERHVAQAFQEALFATVGPEALPGALVSLLGADPGPTWTPVSVQNAIRTHLMKAGKPGYVEETFVGLDHAYQMVLALGGVPCYPVLADGAQPVCEFEQPVERLVAALQEHRVHCAELIPNRNAVPVLGAYVRALRQAGIAVLAGTEHNTLDMVPMEPHCAGGEPVPEDLRTFSGRCMRDRRPQVPRCQREKRLCRCLRRAGPVLFGTGRPYKGVRPSGAAVIEKYADMARTHERYFVEGLAHGHDYTIAGFCGPAALLEALVELSHSYGSDPELVLAGGGNTSVKFDDHMLVKGSGTALADIRGGGLRETSTGRLSRHCSSVTWAPRATSVKLPSSRRCWRRACTPSGRSAPRSKLSCTI